MLGFQESLHALCAQFAPPTALFHATEGRLTRSGDPVIDPDHSGFDRFGEAKHAAQVASEGVSAETVRRAVRPVDCLDFGIERANGSDRRECFFEHAQGAFGHVR